MAAARDDQGLHVGRGELHRLRDRRTQAFCSADRQDGQGQRRLDALLVLRGGGIGRAVVPDAAAQGRGAAGQLIDVDLDGAAGQRPRARPGGRRCGRRPAVARRVASVRAAC